MDNPKLQEYAQLLAKVAAKVAEIAQRQADALQCRAGCHACCAPELTVTAVEAAAIAEFLQQNPPLLVDLLQLAQDDPWQGKRCAFLRADGQCGIYAVRPLVCRTQGLPIVLENGALTACELNFLNGLETLPLPDRVDQRTLSTLLFVVNQRFGGHARRALTVEGVLGPR